MNQSAVSPAKISPPKLAAALPRQRLFGLLDELRNVPILWIGGCPGAGKTTLIANYLEERNLPGLWYRVDREDHDGQALVDYLTSVGAVVTPPPKEQAGAEEVQRSGLSAAAHTGLLRRRLVFELFKRLPQPGMLVLDDCHEVAPDASLHALIVDSAGEIPLGFNVVLLGRGEPPALYSRLIANGTMGTIDSHDLQLTLDETCALAGRISADPRAPRLLHDECAGWAAGIAMTLERLRRNAPEGQSVAQEMRRAVFGYYAGEVFDRASSEDRRILVATALMPRISTTIANDLCRSTRAQQLLNKLESQQLFTQRSTGAPDTYEYTP